MGVINLNPSRDLDPIRRLTRAKCDVDKLTDCVYINLYILSIKSLLIYLNVLWLTL